MRDVIGQHGRDILVWSTIDHCWTPKPPAAPQGEQTSPASDVSAEACEAPAASS